MSKIFLHAQSPYPATIKFLRSFVVWATVLFAALFDLATAGSVTISPTILLLSPTFGISWLWQTVSSALTIPYQGFGLQMVFDLMIINFFLTPIISFVFSFLTKNHFLSLLFSLIAIGAGSFLGFATLFGQAATPPCSLFAGLSLSIVIFWALLHRKGQSTLLLAFPISRFWAIAITAFASLYSPVTMSEWAHVGAILCMATASYIWGIARWKLRSYIDSLEGFEQWLDSTYGTISRFLQWYIFRPFRRFRQ